MAVQYLTDANTGQKMYTQGVPMFSDYTPTYTSGMAITPQVEGQLQGINYNEQALQRLRADALRKGTSKWSALSKQKQFAEEMDARERAKREASSTAAEAESKLAMSGGLSSGARERLAQQGAKLSMASSQDVGRQGGINRLGIDVADEQNRIAQLSALPGQENIAYQAAMQKQGAWAKARDVDIQRAIAENQQRNQYNLMREQMNQQAIAAERQAQATENSGKK